MGLLSKIEDYGMSYTKEEQNEIDKERKLKQKKKKKSFSSASKGLTKRSKGITFKKYRGPF